MVVEAGETGEAVDECEVVEYRYCRTQQSGQLVPSEQLVDDKLLVSSNVVQSGDEVISGEARRLGRLFFQGLPS